MIEWIPFRFLKSVIRWFKFKFVNMSLSLKEKIEKKLEYHLGPMVRCRDRSSFWSDGPMVNPLPGLCLCPSEGLDQTDRYASIGGVPGRWSTTPPLPDVGSLGTVTPVNVRWLLLALPLLVGSGM